MNSLAPTLINEQKLKYLAPYPSLVAGILFFVACKISLEETIPLQVYNWFEISFLPPSLVAIPRLESNLPYYLQLERE